MSVLLTTASLPKAKISVLWIIITNSEQVFFFFFCKFSPVQGESNLGIKQNPYELF